MQIRVYTATWRIVNTRVMCIWDDGKIKRSSYIVWLPTVKQSMVIVPASLLSKQTNYDIFHIRCCHVSDETIPKMSTLGIQGIPVYCTHGSRIFYRSCALAKSTTTNINRGSTRIDDPDTCFHTLAIDIWGPVDTPSIGNFSYMFGVVCCKSCCESYAELRV